MNWFEPELVYKTVYDEKCSKDLEHFLRVAARKHVAMIEDTVEQFALWICDHAEGESVWLEFEPELRVVSSHDLLEVDEEGDPYGDDRGAPIQFYSAEFTYCLLEALERCEPSCNPVMKLRNEDRYCKRGELVVYALLYLALGSSPVWDQESARLWWWDQKETPLPTKAGQLGLFV